MRAPYIPSEHSIKGLNAAPSPWVKRFCPLFSPDAKVLDMACGAGRNTKVLAAAGNKVTALDIDERCKPYIEAIPGASFLRADLEGAPWPFEKEVFDAVVVTFYLDRNLFPKLVEVLKPGGYLIYETFMMPFVGFKGNRAKNEDFVLRPLELIEVFRDRLEVCSYEESLIDKGDCLQRFLGRKPLDGKNEPVILPD